MDNADDQLVADNRIVGDWISIKHRALTSVGALCCKHTFSAAYMIPKYSVPKNSSVNQ